MIHCIVYFFLIVVSLFPYYCMSLFIAVTSNIPISVFNKALKNHFQAIYVFNLTLFQIYIECMHRIDYSYH